MTFEGKRILVTGSTRGIGKVAAERFLGAGASVAISGRSRDTVDSLVAALSGNAVAAAGDVSTAAGCETVVASALDSLGGLDVLVNNAGIYPIVPFEDTDEMLYDRAMNSNVKSMFFCSQFALPALREGGGVIVNHASIAGLHGFSGIAAYCTSKAAMVGFTRALAMEVAPDVRVNCVCPATIDTEMGRQEFDITEDPAAAFAAFEAASSLRRIGTADDVAAAIAFLACDESSYMTGIALPVDGGKTSGRAKTA